MDSRKALEYGKGYYGDLPLVRYTIIPRCRYELIAIAATGAVQNLANSLRIL